MSEEPSSSDLPVDLARRARVLTMAVTDLGAEVRRLDARERRTKRVAVIAFAGLVVDLVLSAVVIGVGFVLGGEVDRLEATNARLEKLFQGQCGQLALFIGSYRPESRPPEARAEYERAFAVMRAQYADLGCDPGAIVPPATTTPTPPPPR